MTQLPRIDEIEDLLGKEVDTRRITINLEEDLISELKELNLLKSIIKSRIQKFIENTIKSHIKADETDDKEDNTEELLNQLAHEWFEYRVDRYYLEQRDSYERISFQMFRTGSKRIANEAYQRLIENEESWRTIIERWGLEADKKNEGKHFQVSPSKLYKEVYKELKRLNTGEISQPMRAGKFIAILKLLKWSNIELNDELKHKIERDMYQEWLNEKTEHIVNRLS